MSSSSSRLSTTAIAAAAAVGSSNSDSTTNDNDGLVCQVCQSSKPKPLGVCQFDHVMLHVECGTSHFQLLTEENVVWRYGKGKAARGAMDTCQKVTPTMPPPNKKKKRKRDEEEEEEASFYYLASEIESVKGVRLLKRAAKDTKPPSSPNSQTKKDAAAKTETKGVAKEEEEDQEKEEEKRLARYRPTCSHALSQRIHRAKSQRMYLVCQSDVQTDTPPYGGPSCTFTVLGSTGNVYQVQIAKKPSCSCPDAAKGNLCKHLVFVLLKVVGLPSDSPLLYQAALLTSELEDIFATLQARRAAREGNNNNNTVLANAAVRARYQQLTCPEEERQDQEKEEEKNDSETTAAGSSSNGVQRRSLEDSPECPICCDPMSNSDSLTFCQAACGTNFHLECMTIWAKQQQAKDQETTCPACRQPWLDETVAKKSAGTKRSSRDEGYTNLGSLQGLSAVRDTSTYSDGYRYGRRYWRRRYDD